VLPQTRSPRIHALLGLLVLLCLPACYRGGEREKEPPPGYPGGFCLAPSGTCYDGACDIPGGAYCYDPADPCRGIFCGGNGSCLPNAEAKPTCACDPGYSNATYALFCEPAGGSEAPATDGMGDGGMSMPDAGG